MALVNLFASLPGEVDPTPGGHRLDQPYQNTNPKKRKRKNHVPSDEAWKQSHSQGHRVPFKEEQVDNHKKHILCFKNKKPSQNSLWPGFKSHQKEGQAANGNKKPGQETNRRKGGVFQDQKGGKGSKRTGNAFNQRGTGSRKGRGGGRMEKQRVQWQERKPFMTQDFKEQNSINVNERLICKHFLRDRCLKGDQCQFEHSHDLGSFKFNEVCKFYVQGFCLKGERCLFMHKTFPCKFFHTGRKCYQDNNCKFSHEPLTELTKGLLDKLLEEQKAARVPLQCDTQDPEPKSAVDLTNPIKLSFYSTAPAPECLSAGQLGSGMKEAGLTLESPSSPSQIAPLLRAHTPHTVTQPAPSPAQNIPVKFNFFNSDPCPKGQFMFGANDADFTLHPSSARPPRRSAAQTDPTPNPFTASPETLTPTPSPAQLCLPATTVSSAPAGPEESPSGKSESSRSPTPPSGTFSVLRTLFSHLSPCRPDDEEEEDLNVRCSRNAADTFTNTSCMINVPKACTKDPARVKEERESDPMVPEPVPDAKTEPREPVDPPKREPHFAPHPLCHTSTEMKEGEADTEKPDSAPLKQVPSASTPNTNMHRTYRPLAMDLSPFPLPFTAYRPQPPPGASPQAISSNTLRPRPNSHSQSDVRCHVSLQPQACKTQTESQGRHSLPVQTLTWSVPSTRLVSQPVLRNKSLRADLDSC